MNAPALLALPVARATRPSNMSKMPPKMMSRPATSQAWAPAAIAATHGDAEADQGERVGRQAQPGEEPRPTGSASAADPGPQLRGDERAAHASPASSGLDGGQAEGLGLAGREHGERLRLDGVDGLPAVPPRGHEPDLAELGQVPGDEGLGQPDPVA